MWISEILLFPSFLIELNVYIYLVSIFKSIASLFFDYFPTSHLYFLINLLEQIYSKWQIHLPIFHLLDFIDDYFIFAIVTWTV